MQMDDSVLFRLLQLVSIQKIFVRTAALEVQMRFTELHTGIALDAARLKKSAVRGDSGARPDHDHRCFRIFGKPEA